MVSALREPTIQRDLAPSGTVQLHLVREPQPVQKRSLIAGLIRDAFPRPGLPREVNAWRARNAHNLIAPIAKLAMGKRLGLCIAVSTLRLTLIREGRQIEMGLASMKLVTDVGVGYIVDSFQNSVEMENQKYHGFGTGTTAEAASQTALVTELTTQYVTDNTRPTGTTIEGATANIYRTVATLAPDSGGTIAITEHGVFSATSAGVLLDRSVFAAVNVVAGADSLVATYDLTFTSGS